MEPNKKGGNQFWMWFLAAVISPLAHFSGVGCLAMGVTAAALLPLTAVVMDGWEGLGKKLAFLETADYLILPLEGNVTVSELLTLLRPSVRVCLGEGEMDLEAARAYLSVHEPAVTLYGLHAGEQGIETLTMNEGRGALGTQ